MTTVQSQCHTFTVHALLYAKEMRRRNQLILNDLAPRHGFEPRFTAPKAAVLPLDDRGKIDSSQSIAARFLVLYRR